MKRESYKTLGEALRFALVGVIATAIHYSIYWGLKQWIDFNIAYTVGYIISFVCNFVLTSVFTFKKKANIRRGIGFGGAHLFNYLFQMALLNVFIRLGIDQSFAPIPVYAIAIPINFLLVRFVFKNQLCKSSNT